LATKKDRVGSLWNTKRGCENGVLNPLNVPTI